MVRLFPVAHDAVAGLILAGGRGLRMGGTDKGLVEWQGQTLVRRCIEDLQPQVQAVSISANRNLDKYRQLGCEVVADPLPGFCGPLAGMLGGLLQARLPWLACVPCDMPVLPPDLVSRLLKAAQHERRTAAYATFAGEAQYACNLLHLSLRPSLELVLADGERSVRRWFASVGAIAVEAGDAPHFGLNLNTPADLQVAAA